MFFYLPHLVDNYAKIVDERGRNLMCDRTLPSRLVDQIIKTVQQPFFGCEWVIVFSGVEMSGDFMHVSIDIHSNQLLDWLVDRRHCSRNYQTSLSKVKEELTHALQLIPPGRTILSIDFRFVINTAKARNLSFLLFCTCWSLQLYPFLENFRFHFLCDLFHAWFDLFCLTKLLSLRN